MSEAVTPRPPDVSICMVSLDCWAVLEPCLDSLLATSADVSYEVLLVDNGSTDGTPAKVREQYPWVHLIENGANVGFTKATNQGIDVSTGRFVLWLNTDTLLRPDSLVTLVHGLEGDPRRGVVGPKVLNADGSFQEQCRRGMPTPMASLAYMLRLDRLFPHNKRLGQYLLRYLPVDAASQVAAVSGCCLLARREVYADIGPLDNDIFGFGEDLDWCVRASHSGWQVWYDPSSEIVHLKGQGGVHSKPFRKVWAIHQAMWIFFRKHLASQYSPPVRSLVWLGIRLSYLASLGAVFVRRLRPASAHR